MTHTQSWNCNRYTKDPYHIYLLYDDIRYKKHLLFHMKILRKNNFIT